MVERFRWRFWSVNVVLFVCLAVPALLVGGAGWPLRLAATAGLAGACVWEAAALRARRVPLWADVLETVAVAVVSWRYPTGMGLLVLVLAFALPALGFRVLYSTPWQAAARTVTVLAAVYAGSIHDPSALLHGMPPVILAAVVVVFLSGELARMYHQRAAVAYRWRIAARLNADLAAARGRGDVHTAILRAVLDLLQGQTDVRVIIWDEPSSLQPTVAAGSLAGEVRPGGGQPLSAVTWVRDALVAGELAYRESYDVDQMRRVLGFDPIPGVILVVPLRHGEDVRALSVDASEPIPAPVRAEIANLAKVGEIALGSIERTRVNLEELRERSSYDPHTHLGNRDLPRLRLEQALAPGRPVALLLLHIGHFRTINDSLGNISGGEALVTLAGRLVGCVRPGDTVARLGGDEFAILLNPLADPATAERVASHVLGVLDEPLPSIILGSRTGMFVRGSIGVALSGPAARTPNDLLRNAEVAMDAAETAGGGVYRVFEPAMRASILQRLELGSDLSRALDRDELVLHYQPIVQLPAWRPISGVEALIRWNHPQRGMVSPARFIPARRRPA